MTRLDAAYPAYLPESSKLSGRFELREQVVGVISDTHGLLRPEAVEALVGVDLIVHAGDVGKPAVLERLQTLAPVVAVRGNVDGGALAQLPATRRVEVGDAVLYVLHNLVNLGLDPREFGMSAVISGHSHKPVLEWRGDVLYLNPGAAGPRRLELPVTVARVRVNGRRLAAEIITLPV